MKDHEDDPQSQGSTLTGFISGFLLVVFGGVCGAVLGLLFVRLFVPRTGMGWDQLADALGGLMVGGLLGLVAGGVLIFLLGTRGRFLAAGVLLVVAIAGVVGMAWTREPRPASEPVVREKPFEPWFRVTVRVGHSEEVLQAS